MARTIQDVAITDIEVPKSIVRRVNLDSDGGGLLVESARRQGFIHPPLVRSPAEPGGKYRLVCGQRRLAVAKKLGLKTLQVAVDDDMSDQEAEYAQLAENLCRQGPKSANDYRK